MIEAIADLWNIDADALAITTNGYTTRSGNDRGRGVMGKGVAEQARNRYPGIEAELGRLLHKYGNKCFVLFDGPPAIVSMPVKEGKMPPQWERATLPLIERSARELVVLADLLGWQRIAVPRPGCGAGGLSWSQVKPVLEPIFDDRFIVIWRG